MKSRFLIASYSSPILSSPSYFNRGPIKFAQILILYILFIAICTKNLFGTYFLNIAIL